MTRARSALALFDMSSSAAISVGSGGWTLLSEFITDADFRGVVRALAMQTLCTALTEIEQLRQTERKGRVA